MYRFFGNCRHHYLKEKDVHTYYTRKDEVTVDSMVIEEYLKKLEDEAFLRLIHLVTQHRLQDGRWAELSEMVKPYSKDAINIPLLLISQATRDI